MGRPYSLGHCHVNGSGANCRSSYPFQPADELRALQMARLPGVDELFEEVGTLIARSSSCA